MLVRRVAALLLLILLGALSATALVLPVQAASSPYSGSPGFPRARLVQNVINTMRAQT
jgi:hypothetical protein